MATILVVDDDLLSKKLVCDLLKVHGYITVEAADGKEAVEEARRNIPALILMDIHLPVMDGLEATRIIKADPLTRGIIILALTASAMPGDEEKSREAGCDGYISKPIEIIEFMKEIKSYLAQK